MCNIIRTLDAHVKKIGLHIIGLIDHFSVVDAKIFQALKEVSQIILTHEITTS